MEYDVGDTTSGVKTASYSIFLGRIRMRINGVDIILKSPQTLENFLKTNNYVIERIVIELNGEIISKEKYSTINLKNSDIIEVLTFVGGG
jgi:sulfur carrier protein